MLAYRYTVLFVLCFKKAISAGIEVHVVCAGIHVSYSMRMRLKYSHRGFQFYNQLLLSFCTCRVACVVACLLAFSTRHGRLPVRCDDGLVHV